MNQINIKKLKDISDAFAVMTYEKPTVELICKYLDEADVKYEFDNYGNILVGNTKNPKKAFAAHLDEIGFMVKKIEDNGLIKFGTVGFIHPVTMLNSIVSFKNNGSFIEGYVLSGRMFAGGLSNYDLKITDLYVDIGATSKQEVIDRGIDVGTVGAYKKYFREDKNTISATGLDNSVGIYLLLEMITKYKKFDDTVYLFHKGEECGSFGAQTFANNIKPEYVYVVDYFPAKIDSERLGDIYPEYGQGPAVVYMSSGYVIEHDIKKRIENTAKKEDVKLQKCFMNAKGTSEVIHFQVNGAKGANICVPSRGFHGQVYIAQKSDILDTYKLLVGLLNN